MLKSRCRGSLILVLLFTILLLLVLAVWTDNNLEWVISSLKEVPRETVQVPYYLSLGATVLSCGLAVPFNVVCEIIKVVE